MGGSADRRGEGGRAGQVWSGAQACRQMEGVEGHRPRHFRRNSGSSWPWLDAIVKHREAFRANAVAARIQRAMLGDGTEQPSCHLFVAYTWIWFGCLHLGTFRLPIPGHSSAILD